MGTQTQARPRSRRQMARRERELGALAARQHGVLSREQLIDAGLGVRTIQRRVEAGRIHRLHRGVYAFGAEKVNQRGAWFAAVLACGDDAVLSHQSAMQAAGYRVVRLTHRRLKDEPAAVASQLRALLAAASNTA